MLLRQRLEGGDDLLCFHISIIMESYGRSQDPMNFRDAAAGDWLPIEALLSSCELPLDGAHEHLALFSVCDDGDVIGCAGAEQHGDAALLRSVAVTPHARSSG